MKDTKERILLTSLQMFARNGYEGVSVSQIANEIGIVKSALYKHFKSKRDIFDSILERMTEMDYARAKKYEVPESTISNMRDKYENTPMDNLAAYCEAQFVYWTEEEFPSLFRRMLTIEQYRSREMLELYHQYLCNGPLVYVEDILSSILGKKSDGRALAIEFYSPMFMLFSIYDFSSDTDRGNALEELRSHIKSFKRKYF